MHRPGGTSRSCRSRSSRPALRWSGSCFLYGMPLGSSGSGSRSASPPSFCTSWARARPENFCKLFGVTAIGFWFLRYFESLSWIVLVALIIPWVDAYSVWRGPTKVIVTEHRSVFTNFSFAFPIPGENGACKPRPARPAVLRPVPGGVRAVEPPAAADVAVADAVFRRNACACGLARHRRPACAAVTRARVPARKRRPAVDSRQGGAAGSTLRSNRNTFFGS